MINAFRWITRGLLILYYVEFGFEYQFLLDDALIKVTIFEEVNFPRWELVIKIFEERKALFFVSLNSKRVPSTYHIFEIAREQKFVIGKM
ncbi:hypothetical protein HF325_003056 [Metschnikowia pulcherrima]|uniref:Uncharacterized protein n=1 Tax=Metschnikowia pulcherrima TaxID=27326 RepID=A0A8H7GTG0_9ASCO|nr:hypothetical protein HF325_003056 [Metschnikowia pulcherrima]